MRTANIALNRIRVLCGFCGVGKSTLMQKQPDNFIDLDSALFKKDDPQRFENYVKEIKNLLASTDKGIFVSTHPTLIEMLTEQDIPFVLVHPQRELKDVYLKRYRDRGDWAAFLVQLEKDWDLYLDDLEGRQLDGDSKRIVLAKDENLSDKIDYTSDEGFVFLD